MSRYRKIEVCLWADNKFRSLSPLLPSGQSLWLFLLTGPHTGPIPGLFRAGQMAMAEELGWELEAFREAFQEVFREGLAKADWKARVVWIPNAIRYNMPQSPNVIKSWEEELNIIPECALKTEALHRIRLELEAFGEAYLSVFDEITKSKTSRKPFDKPSGKPFGKPFDKPSGKTMPNQEQEQEQKQEQEEKTVKARAARAPIPKPVTDVFDFPDEFEAAWLAYPKRNGGNPKIAAFRAWGARIKEGHSHGEILAGTNRYAAWCAATGKVNTEFVKQASTFFGPEKAFLDEWNLPVSRPSLPFLKAEQLEAHNQRAIAEWLAQDKPVIEGEISHVAH